LNFELIVSAFSSQPLPILATVLAISAAFLMGFARSGLGVNDGLKTAKSGGVISGR
jgi:dUTPase